MQEGVEIKWNIFEVLFLRLVNKLFFLSEVVIVFQMDIIFK